MLLHTTVPLKKELANVKNFNDITELQEQPIICFTKSTRTVWMASDANQKKVRIYR